jgi:hypothetical protein
MEALQLPQYDEWIADHLDELVTQHAGQVVAIHQGKIAIIGNSEVDVYREVREVGLEPMPLVLRVPRVTTPTVDIGTLITHTPDVRGGAGAHYWNRSHGAVHCWLVQTSTFSA